MLFYVSTARQIRLSEALRAQCPPALGARLACRSYEWLVRQRRLPPGTWLFADIERLTVAQAEHMAQVHATIVEAGWPALNHPTRSRGRYELLRLLHGHGVNPFDAYLASEHRVPQRWPVFVRRAVEHSGADTDLLPDPAALAAALAAHDAAGIARTDTLVVEFCATADADGTYRKYGAYCVGGHIIPRHVLCSRQWEVKNAASDPAPADIALETAYVHDNPHQQALGDIFALARIEYGRVDYALRDGRPVVFEINTHPAHALVPAGVGHAQRQAARDRFRQRFVAALTDLARDVPGASIRVPPPPGAHPRRPWWRRWRKRMRNALRAPG